MLIRQIPRSIRAPPRSSPRSRGPRRSSRAGSGSGAVRAGAAAAPAGDRAARPSGARSIAIAGPVNARQILAGAVPPLTLPSDLLSSRPTHTPTTRSPAKPTKMASRLSWVVPVLPKVGDAERGAAAGALVGRRPQQVEHRRPVALPVERSAARRTTPPSPAARPRSSAAARAAAPDSARRRSRHRPRSARSG